MTSLCALVSGFGWHVADLERAAQKIGVSLRAVEFPRVSASVGMTEPARGRSADLQSLRNREFECQAAGDVDLMASDGVLVRMMPPGSLEQVVFRMDALHRIAAAGVPVLNPPRAVEAAVDKYLTLSLLDRAGIPVPPTWAGESATEALEAFDALGGDVVVKPLFGSEGRGLMRISDAELAWRTFHALERLNAVLYFSALFAIRGMIFGSLCCEARSWV